MLKPDNWDDIQPASTVKPPFNTWYICVIKGATEGENKDFEPTLKLEFDICSGEYSGFYTTQGMTYNKNSLIKHTQLTSLETVLPYYKKMILCIEASNPDYKFDFTAASLIGKKVGLLLEEYEFEMDNGKIGRGKKVGRFCAIDEVENNNLRNDTFSTKHSTNSNYTNNSVKNDTFNFNDDDLPF